MRVLYGKIYKRVNLFTLSFVLAISSIGAALPLFLFQNASANSVNIFPSTNIQNIANGWANVSQTGATQNSITLKFSSTRNFVSCFEYRIDGNISQAINTKNYNSEIIDNLYPFYCLTNNIRTQTFSANSYVEVRQSFGAERDERFNWTRFNIVDTSSTKFVNNLNYTRENNGSDLAAQIVTPDETTDVRFFVDGDLNNPIAGRNIGGAGATTSWWRLYVPLEAGEHSISAEIKLNGVWYPVVDKSSTYSIDLPWAQYIVPQTNQSYRSNDMVVRVKADDEFNQFNRMVTTVNGVSHTVSRNDCADQGEYVICDLSNLNLPEGQYTANTTTYTKANNRADNVISSQFNIDNTKPQIMGLTVENSISGIVGRDLLVSASAIDNKAVESIKFYITSPRVDGVCTGNGSIFSESRQSSIGTDNKYRITLDVAGLNGEYCITAMSRDTAMNNSTAVHQKITVDTEIPSTPLITSPTVGQFFRSSPIRATWKPAIDNDGISKYQVEYIYDDGHTFAGTLCDGRNVCREVNSNQAYRDHNPGLNEQGGVTIRVRAYDKVGNVGQWSEPVHYVYDAKTPAVPNITFKSKGSEYNIATGGYTNLNNFTFNLLSDKDTIRYQLKYWNNIPSSSFKEKTPWIQSDLKNYSSSLGIYNDKFTQGEGTHYFVFSACDAAGNCSNYSNPFAITYDNTSPIGKIDAITSPVGGATKNIKITGNVDDINIVSYQLIITNEAGETIKDTTKLVRGSITDLDDWDISSLISGKYTLKLIATDIVGHISTDTKEVTVDNTAPVINYADSNIKDNEITPKITLDDYKDFNWTADPLNPTGVVFDDLLIAPIFTVINDGLYKFTLTVKDELGNVSSREFSFNYTAPVAAAQASVALTAVAPVLPRVASTQFTNVSVDRNTQGEVLGAQTSQPEVSVVDNSNTAEVKGLIDAKKADGESQSIFGFAWYWWIVGIAFAGITGWAGVKFLGRNDNRENI